MLFLAWMGCYLQKYPDLSHSIDTWKMKLFNAQKPRGATLINGRIHHLEVIEGGTRLAMPKAISVRSTSLLKTGSWATEGVLD